MKILLGVTGCIAAYKAAELLRLLQKQGYEVQVAMTDHAQKFVTPLTFAALTNQRVLTRMFESDDQTRGADAGIDHVRLPHTIAALLVAPATANILAKFARGLADDFLSTLYLANTSPVIIAPAMNVTMWQHPAVQENLEILRARGHHIVEPGEGYLAEGITGKGRLADLDQIVEAVNQITCPAQDLAGETVLVTAGPTCEDLDPVRFLTNRSSGKMGYALAEAARRRGARVILVSGPTELPVPDGVDFVPVRSAAQMRSAVLQHFEQASLILKAAAVADFQPAELASRKIKKSGQPFPLELKPTPDILAELGRKKTHQFLVGFAAETDKVQENALKKLREKNLDLLVANDVTQPGAGFDVDTNIVTLLDRHGHSLQLDRQPKTQVAQAILDRVVALKKK